jgi:hypothetical protein
MMVMARTVRGTGESIEVEDDQSGWHLRAEFAFFDGAPWISHLEIYSSKSKLGLVPVGGITTAVLRKISTSALYEQLGADEGSAFTLALHGRGPDEDFLATRRPGRRGRDDEFYAMWAERYVAKCAGGSRRPFPDLADEYPGYTARSIRDIIQQAKARKLLAGGSQGRAGGKLTPRGQKLLRVTKAKEQS